MTTDAKRLVRFDWAIKNIFKRKKHLDILEDFISEFLGKKLKIKSLEESESIKANEDDKSNRVDVLVETKSGENIIIEVQAYSELDYFSRILYGGSKVVTQNIKAGESYKKIPRIISINIVYAGVGMGEDYIYRGVTEFKGMHYNDILELSDAEKVMYFGHASKVSDIFIEYFIIKVRNFKEEVKDIIDEWVYFLKNEQVKGKFHSSGLKKAANQLKVLKMPLKERLEYEKGLEKLSDDKSMAETIELSKAIIKQHEHLVNHVENLEKKHKREVKELKIKRQQEIEELEQKRQQEIEELEQKRQQEAINIKADLAEKLLKTNLPLKEIETVTGISIDNLKKM